MWARRGLLVRTSAALSFAFLASLGAPPAAACDTALLALIMRRDRRSEFEAAVQALSATLLEAGRAARAGDRAGVRLAAASFLDGWEELYERHYAAPPRGHEGDPRWRQTCDHLTRAAQALTPGRLPTDLEALHPALRGLQDGLAAFYLAPPGQAGPQADFEMARAQLAGLLDEAASARVEAARLAAGIEALAARVQAATTSLPPDSPARAAWSAALEAVRGGETPLAALGPRLDELRSATLARLWFPGGDP